MNLYETISRRRKALGINQTTLAQLSGVGISTLKNFERGKGNPSIKTLEQLCDVLGLDIELNIRKVEL